MLMLSPENITGLVVGEGCFYVESSADSKYRLGWRIRPGFCIEMRADETPVLEAVRRTLGCGTVYHLDFGRYRGYEGRGWQPHAKYRVTRIDDLTEKVIPFFQKYPLFGRKRKAFELFNAIVVDLAAGRHRDPDQLEAVQRSAERLKQHNSGGRLRASRTDA